jgi:HSP20 family protein
MNKFNNLLIISLLANTGNGFSVPVTQHSTEKAVTQKDAPVSEKETPTAPLPARAFIRPSSLVNRNFDDLLFPRSSFSSLFDDFFDFRPRLLSSMDIMPSLLDDFTGHKSDMMLRTTKSSPRYEITEDDKSMTLIIDVPGVKAEDIAVEIEAEGKMLHVSGKRITKKDDNVSKYSFDKRFGIGGRFDGDNVTANLADGVLTVVAPKLEPEVRDVKKVEITEGSQDVSVNDE